MTIRLKRKTLFRSSAVIVAAAALALAGGCGSDGETPSDAQEEQGATMATVPSGFFASAAPAEAPMLIDVKTAAGVGEEVTFTARVGGQRDPFMGSVAMFLVVDPSLLSCDQIPGDNCRYPWDYCCEPKENLRKHMATVQVMGDDGAPLSGSLSGVEGLEGGATIVVTGTVSEKDENGSFVVDATSVHVISAG